jgi:transposase
MRKLDEETIKKIELDISRTLIKKGIKPKRLVFDTTNFYTHIEHGEELPQKSHSKEKRYDKNLVGIGLIASDHDIPFQTITYPANVSDSDIFPGIIDSICERLQNIDIPAEDMTIIFDRGMNSTPNIEKALDKMHVVGSLPSSMCKELFKMPISDFKETWKNGNENPIMACHVAGNWYDKDLIGIIRYNEVTKRKQMREWDNNKPKILGKVDEIKSKLNREGKGRKITEKGLMNRIVDAVPKQYRGLFDYSVVKVEGKLQMDFKLIETRENEFVQGMGKTVIFTDIKDLTVRQISDMYDARNRIETDIKWLKDKLLIPLKPIYVRKDRKIRAHVFLCVTGLLLYNYLLHEINDKSLSIKKLAEYLDEMRLGLIYNDKIVEKNKKNAQFVIEEMGKKTAEIFSNLQLGKFIPN